MIVLLEIIALGVIALIAVNIWTGMRTRRLEQRTGTIGDGAATDLSSPGKRAAALLKAYENERAALKARYPSIFAMLGGYLNAHTILENGGVEGAVREMLDDWRPRADQVTRELTKLLAENESEEECRAIVTAACDADLDAEGYRKWLTWLLGRFNPL